MLQVRAGDLQAVEHEPGDFRLHLATRELLEHLHDRYLHGIRIFQQAHRIHRTRLDLVLTISPAAIAHAMVKIAVSFTAQRRRPALRAIDLHMLTSWNIVHTHVVFLLT